MEFLDLVPATVRAFPEKRIDKQNKQKLSDHGQDAQLLYSPANQILFGNSILQNHFTNGDTLGTQVVIHDSRSITINSENRYRFFSIHGTDSRRSLPSSWSTCYLTYSCVHNAAVRVLRNLSFPRHC